MNPTTEEGQGSVDLVENKNPLAVLDDLEPEQLVFVKEVLRKPRPLEAGEFASKHDAWKRAEIELLFQDISTIEIFQAGSVVYALALFLKTLANPVGSHNAILMVANYVTFISGITAAVLLAKKKVSI